LGDFPNRAFLAKIVFCSWIWKIEYGEDPIHIILETTLWFMYKMHVDIVPKLICKAY
jgi:hypothetical protein